MTPAEKMNLQVRSLQALNSVAYCSVRTCFSSEVEWVRVMRERRYGMSGEVNVAK